MAFRDWREPVQLLEEETAKTATEQQRELATMTGLTLIGNEPQYHEVATTPSEPSYP